METPTGEPRWPSLRPRKGETNSSPYRQVFLGFRALVVILFLILIAQLVRLQVVESGKYQERAEINALRELVEPSARGLIYDREGRPLVQNVARYFAAVIPADLPERGEIGVYRQLGQVIGMKAEEIDQKVKEQSQKQGPLTPVLVKEDLSRETAMVLREVEPHLPGVRLLIQPTRAYLQGSMLSHVLGYVGSISEEEYAQLRIQGYQLQDRVGKAGVEMVYEKLLRGRPGKKLVEVDSEGREKRVISEKRPQDGANILLTIDLDLQQYLYNVLKQYADRSDNAAAAIMDVHSGEVLAMVSLPEYDNNIFSRKVTDQELAQLTNDPGKPLLNHAIGEMYPPGSTFKTIVGAAALQEKVATPATSITSRGVIYVENEFDPNIIYRFPDWAALGTLDFYGGLAMSSNVYFY
ncbi:MAG TPA: penicillin-binding transpeptidase domain-containing protein, partial [Dehalococcoidia bacterium]|nr:penicillin-binding transpeptidase domain-containing protein [Dehalococcoidia bacterium]